MRANGCLLLAVLQVATFTKEELDDKVKGPAVLEAVAAVILRAARLLKRGHGLAVAMPSSGKADALLERMRQSGQMQLLNDVATVLIGRDVTPAAVAACIEAGDVVVLFFEYRSVHVLLGKGGVGSRVAGGAHHTCSDHVPCLLLCSCGMQVQVCGGVQP